MKSAIYLITVILIVSCVNRPNIKDNDTVSKDDTSKTLLKTDNSTILKTVPTEMTVSGEISDTSIAIFTEKCVVFSMYSDKEFDEMENQSGNPDEWEALYDDISYYANEASLFLYEKTKVNYVRDENLIQFIMSSGEKLTIDRKKSREIIFFFNPETGVKQCDTYSFNKEEYDDY